ncbi:hypothetical protein [Mesorhizobium sp. B1-1-6]|uniref:hypothetical protein n=1 Tax=Mesorhizobium sp. B1-1-6 TaxID=2589978 RepID=UPI0015E488BE|nr:hypothetical protein [Mesorhizobium sp. B1-1-6]
MGIDLFAQRGGELEIAIPLVRSGNRKQCLEGHGGNSSFRVKVQSLLRHSRQEPVRSLRWIKRLGCGGYLIRINVLACQGCRLQPNNQGKRR